MSQRILIADDDYDLRTIVSDYLRSLGFETVLATNGEEALSGIKAQKPDLVVLDLSMPKMSGWDVAKAVREDPESRRIPIIAFTAHALKGADTHALESGCDAYLAKPFDPDVLLEKIRKLLPKS